MLGKHLQTKDVSQLKHLRTQNVSWWKHLRTQNVCLNLPLLSQHINVWRLHSILLLGAKWWIQRIFTAGPFVADLTSDADAEVCSNTEYCSALGDSMDPVATSSSDAGPATSSDVDFLWWRRWWRWWWWSLSFLSWIRIENSPTRVHAQCLDHFTLWTSLSLRLSLSNKFRLRPKITQKVK